MDFMKMLEDWRRVVARSVLAFHLACAAVGLLTLLGVIAVPFMGDTFPGGGALATAAVTGLLCLLASCALGGGVRYAVYGDFRLLPSRSFRDYFSGDDDGDERAAHVSPPLPARTQRGPDDDLVDQASEFVSGGDLDGFMDVFNRLQGSPATPPGEISEELAPRVREFGLERNCRELWEQGYTVLEDVAPPEYWRDLRATILKAASGDPGAKAGSMGSTLMAKYPVVAEAAINPKMMALAEFSVGAGFILSNVASSIRRKGDPNIGCTATRSGTPCRFPTTTSS